MAVCYLDENVINSGDPIRLSGNGESLVCKKCGKSYISRGKHDSGYCRDCEKGQTFIGGPLNGQKVR